MTRTISRHSRTAKLDKLTVRDHPQVSPDDIKKLQAAMREKV